MLVKYNERNEVERCPTKYKCKNCGHIEYSTEKRYCPDCGSVFIYTVVRSSVRIVTKTMRECSVCNKSFSNTDYIYCPDCGKRITERTVEYEELLR